MIGEDLLHIIKKEAVQGFEIELIFQLFLILVAKGK